MSESGKAITLLNVARHERCILTIFSILGGHQYPVFASTQSEGQALMIPAALFKHLVDESGSLGGHVFQSLSGRLTGILTTFDRIIFQRMDKRIAQLICLLALALLNKLTQYTPFVTLKRPRNGAAFFILIQTGA